MALTYTAIATVTVGSGGAANIEFTSIPATYTDLVIKMSARNNQSTNWNTYYVQLNSTVAGSTRIVYGTGSSTGSDSGTGNIPSWYSGYINGNSATANTFSSSELYMPNYTGTTKKSMSDDSVTENNATAALAVLSASLNDLTSAVTSITLTTVGNFAQYTTAYLYGIKNTV